jgi:uncharacterized membrane protein
MNSPARRLAGSVGLVLGLLVYLFFAAAVGEVIVASKPTWVRIAYFAVVGLVWVLPAGLLVRWMYRTPRRD